MCFPGLQKIQIVISGNALAASTKKAVFAVIQRFFTGMEMYIYR